MKLADGGCRFSRAEALCDVEAVADIAAVQQIGLIKQAELHKMHAKQFFQPQREQLALRIQQQLARRRVQPSGGATLIFKQVRGFAFFIADQVQSQSVCVYLWVKSVR